MKRKAKALCAFLAFVMIICSAGVTAFAEDTSPVQSEQVTEQLLSDLKNGWEKTKSGKKLYYIDGKKVCDEVITVGKYDYYFNSKGILVTNKAVKHNGKTYYLSKKGRVRAFCKKGKFYYADKTRMNKAEKEDFKARLAAERTLARITDGKMTKSQKLYACYKWVTKKPYKTKRKFVPTDYWPATFAFDHFKGSGGECHSDAAAFAYLAAAIGYKNVYVCNDSNGYGGYMNGHAWAEINGRVYDTLFAEAKGFSNYYNVSYKSFKLRPVLHVKLDYDKRIMQ